MTAPTYPTAGFDRWYGRSVWALGEDELEFVVQGHGRRALAALSAYLRYHFGTRQTDVVKPSVREGHAVFVRECGCTPEKHAKHLAERHPDRGPDCDEDCDDYGLPPCRDDWAWIAHSVQPSPTGLPVLWVRP